VRLPSLIQGCVRSLIGVLAQRGLSARDKVALVASALATEGAPAESLAGPNDILQLLESRQFDRVDCFSMRGFAMISTLSRVFGVPHREFLSRGTRCFGEFAFELLTVVPYAYWLHRNGLLELTQSCADTKCLYYFPPRHEEFTYPRSYIPVSEYPSAGRSPVRFDAHHFPEHLDTGSWEPPPYKTTVRNEIFRWSKELCVICNKYSFEPSLESGQPVNFIDVPGLMKLFGMLCERFQVVYVRPRPSDIVGDHQPINDLGEFAEIQARFPDVLTIQQVHAEHPKLSFNELQMKLFANCERFISVLGGSSYLASYFGGKNIVYAREGWEVSCNAYDNWFHLFSGAAIHHARTSDELFDLARRELAC